MTRQDFYSIINRANLLRILRQYPTPGYFYFPSLIRARVHEFLARFGALFSPHYAVKANPHPAILRLMAELGVGADVASAGELAAALENGIPAVNIEFSGPGKTDDELEYAIQNNVGSLNIENFVELEKITQIARQHHCLPNVGVRVNPDQSQVKSGLKMAGETQFGLDEIEALRCLDRIKQNQGRIHFTGIHVHSGSQVLDESSLAVNVETIIQLAQRLEMASGLLMEKINFGGGWGIPYFPGQNRLNLDRLGQALHQLFHRREYHSLLNRCRRIVEPGRFLVAESGIYVTKVLYRKQVRSKQFAIVDGGMHQNYLLAGGMGQIIRRNFELDILAHSDRSPVATYMLDIAGCLCTPQDILAMNVECSQPVEPGDFVVFFNCGAYGSTASPLNFLSHPRPGEFFID
ncbi:MAG: pyridoxal-dependent decarboxylase, exosortase A system-associated [Candidatus Zhuqueibacterota bacterium]